MKICILIPTFNEAKAIGALISAIKQRNIDVYVSDDGSTDDTVRIAKKLGVHVITNAVRTGKGATLRRGFDHLLPLDYTGVIVMDGDGQHAPEDLEGFLKKINEDAQCIIIGDRLINPQGMPWIRLMTNKIMSFIISIGCGQKVNDTQSGFRYINLDIYKNLQITTSGYEIETEVLMKSAKKGYTIYSVPIKTIYGDETSKIQPFHDTIRFLKYYCKEIITPKK